MKLYVLLLTQGRICTVILLDGFSTKIKLVIQHVFFRNTVRDDDDDDDEGDNNNNNNESHYAM
jgi:hypothetical protein